MAYVLFFSVLSNRLTSTVYKMGVRRLYSLYFVGSCFQYSFKTELSILTEFPPQETYARNTKEERTHTKTAYSHGI